MSSLATIRADVRIDLHSELWFVPECEWRSFESRCVNIEELDI